MDSTIEVKVFDDMGHLNYTPLSLPEYVLNQIKKSVKATYPVVRGQTICSYCLLPNVSKKQRINNYVINYELEHLKPEEMPIAKYIDGSNFLCVIDNIFTPQECQNLIEKANNIQTGDKNKAWHQADTGGNYMRVIMVDRQLSNLLWERIKPFLPMNRDSKYKNYKLVYLNDYFRFSRYREGGKFPLHCDGKNYDASRPQESEGYSTESLFTLNIFLNDGFEGGETDFFENNNDITLRTSVKPKAGRGALFWANQYHRGNTVKSTDKAEFKYLLRTDVMGC